MSDDSTAHVLRLLSALITAYERLADVSNEVRRWPEITISRASGARLTGSPFRLGLETFDGAIIFGMGAQWRNSTSVDWTIVVCWSDATWTVHADVGLEHDEGRTVLDDLGSWRSITLEECIGHIERSVDSLVDGLPKIRSICQRP